MTKIFHFARFDLAILQKTFGRRVGPVYCTKIASRLTRTYTDRHGLKDLTRELLGVDISKQQQTSDWGAEKLSEAQLAYAASDVLHLHALRGKLDGLLAREGRSAIAQACFEFLPTRAELDLLGLAGGRHFRAQLIEGARCRKGHDWSDCGVQRNFIRSFLTRFADQSVEGKC